MSTDDGTPHAAPSRRRRFGGPLFLCALGLVLYLPGIRWGLPTTKSWSQDTIAGMRTIGALQGWPDRWQGRYAPLHYLTLGALYRPVLRHWKRTGQCSVEAGDGQLHFAPPYAPKIGLLIFIARATSVAMAIGAALGLWAATRRLTGDDLAAVAAGAVLMIGAAFNYFAHLGNVDVPALFYFTWSLYFFARLLRSSGWVDALLLGLAGSMAITTKESFAGVYPGMALVLLILELRRQRGRQAASGGFLRAIFQAKWLVGIVAFLLPHLLICGALTNPDAYIARLQYWLAPAEGTLHARQYRYPDQLRLLLATIHYAAGAVGWPIIVAMAAATWYTLARHTRTALLVLVPALGYYVIVITPIDFVYSRFLFAPIALCCVLVGVSAASLWRHKTWPAGVRLTVLGAFLLPTAGYAVAVNAEMIGDTRYQAEQWFRDNVASSATIGAFSDAQYLPRFSNLGYATFHVKMERRSFDRPQPEYLVLTSYNYEDFDESQRACLRMLVRGELGYKPVVVFSSRYLGAGSSWLSIAGWGAPTPGKISPTVTILRRSGR